MSTTSRSNNMLQIHAVIGQYLNFPESEWRELAELLHEKTYPKGTYLLSAGELGQDVFFIHRGLLRLFYTRKDGREFNKSFRMENDFAGSLSSIVLQEASHFSIQALEESQVTIIAYQGFRAFCNRHPHWERLENVVVRWLAVRNERREAEFLLDSAEVRYRRFMEEYPGLAQRIPQFHIASYLGITHVALSRIRKKLENR